jgi:hypothetical protein
LGVDAWEADDTTTIIGALFDVNAKLDELAVHVIAIRQLLEEGDEEEEED